MAEKTHIQWTDATWPIVNGCRRVSAGCEGCYAERLTATRLKHLPKYAGLAVMTPSGPRWTGESRLWAPDLALPLKWKKPRRIFVADMGDLFYEAVNNEEIAAVFGVMAACPQHTFQCLTKRTDRMREWFRWASEQAEPDIPGDHNPRRMCARAALKYVHGNGRLETEHAVRSAWPLLNVWLGVSVEDQRTADERIPLLLDTPAAVRWVSYEPALGPVDFSNRQDIPRPAGLTHRAWLSLRAFCADCDHSGAAHCGYPGSTYPTACRAEYCDCWSYRPDEAARPGLDWIVVGGESGPRARPFDISWARSVIAQCRAAGVACFVKQMGARAIGDHFGYRVGDEDPHCSRCGRARAETEGERCDLGLRDPKGGNMTEWHEALRVREFPEVRP